MLIEPISKNGNYFAFPNTFWFGKNVAFVSLLDWQQFSHKNQNDTKSISFWMKYPIRIKLWSEQVSILIVLCYTPKVQYYWCVPTHYFHVINMVSHTMRKSTTLHRLVCCVANHMLPHIVSWVFPLSWIWATVATYNMGELYVITHSSSWDVGMLANFSTCTFFTVFSNILLIIYYASLRDEIYYE